MRKMKHCGLLFLLISLIIGGCGAKENPETTDPSEEQKQIVVGFSQVGAESDWRSANTESMKSTFTEEKGYQLIFEDAQQKQTNQITAIRTFIQRDVDYIVLAPVTETGWETVLTEARDAGIPVIIVDRMVDVTDEDLFTCWVGSDFELEGKKVAKWLEAYAQSKGIDPEMIRIADLQGTLGATAQIGRTEGLKSVAEENGWSIVACEPADFTQAMGKEVMESLLKRKVDINVVYCENDNEAFGVIEALEKAGKKIGSDLAAGEIMVLSFDGVKEQALEDVLDNKISCIAECNPLHGPRVEAIIETLESGRTPEKREYVDEELFTALPEITTISVGGQYYSVNILNREKVDDRAALFDSGSYTDQSENVY